MTWRRRSSPKRTDLEFIASETPSLTKEKEIPCGKRDALLFLDPIESSAAVQSEAEAV